MRLFNGALPCGAVVTRPAAPDGFTIADGPPDAAQGRATAGRARRDSARTAIRVRDGKIVEWYRLPDDPDAPRSQPLPEDDPEVEAI